MAGTNPDVEKAMTQVRQVGGEQVELGALFVPDRISPRISRANLLLPVESGPGDVETGFHILRPEAFISFARINQENPRLAGFSDLRAATLTYRTLDGAPLTVVNMKLYRSSRGFERWVGDYFDPLEGPKTEPLDLHSQLQVVDGLTIDGFRGVAHLEGERVVVGQPRLVLSLHFTDGKIQRIA